MTPGRPSPTVSPVVLGAMWHRLRGRDAERERLVREAVDLGVTSIDTAPLYDFGGSEALLGRALAGLRQQVQLLTKVGLRWDADHGEPLFEATIDGQRRAVRRDSRPAAVRRDVEESLARLRTDVLDLVQVHHPDRATPIADTMGELLRLREEGKLRAIGVSNFLPEEIRAAARALGEVGLSAVQQHYSLIERSPERGVVAAATAAGAAVLCYSPLECGILAGALLDLSPGDPRWPDRGPLFAPANARAVHAALREAVEPVARAHDATLAQVSLAWLLARPGVTSVICGLSSSRQLAENAGAARLRLEPGEVEQLARRFAGLRIRDPQRTPIARARRRLSRWLRRAAAARGKGA